MAEYLYVSLGSNIEPKFDFLKKAIALLSEQISEPVQSSFFQTKAVDDENQDDFINVCLRFDKPAMKADAILAITQSIENKLGRLRDPKRPKGPRIIDIDLLLYGEEKIRLPNLQLPHPSMFQRNFVLIPLAQIMPEEEQYKYHLQERIHTNVQYPVVKMEI